MFEGSYEFGKRNAYGVSYYKNGNKQYEGFWRSDAYINYGKLYHDNGSLHLEGYFSNNCQNFKGSKYNLNEIEIYKGEMVNHKPLENYNNNPNKLANFPPNMLHLNLNYKAEGEGQSYYISRNNSNETKKVIRYQGIWESDLYNEYGIQYHENGAMRYKGGFRNGKYYGFGEKYDYSGA